MVGFGLGMMAFIPIYLIGIEVLMDERTKVIRSVLRNGSPAKVKAFLLAVGLPSDEHTVVLMHDVEHKDLCFVADAIGVCERQAKKLHRSALLKILDTIE